MKNIDIHQCIEERLLVLFHWTSVDLFNEIDVGKTYKYKDTE
jgi:hypothetical protein